jgi:tetratricopeptide (TPR) repeat protein
MLFNGRADETEAHVKEALGFRPAIPMLSIGSALSRGEALSREHEEGVALGRRSIKLNRNNPDAHLYLAAALQLLGRSEEARKEAEIAL